MSVIGVIDFHLTGDSLVSTRLNGRLQGVGVIEVLHCFGAQIDAELFELAGF